MSQCSYFLSGRQRFIVVFIKEAPMATFRFHALTGCGCLALLTLAACARSGQDEMSWARAALERNHALEVVAADQQSRTFTVRVKDTGELRMVRADEVIAAPALGAGVGEAAEPAPSSTPQTPQPVATPEKTMANAASNAAASGEAAEPAEAQPQTQPASLGPQNAASIESAPGRVLSAGPGYTIKAAAPAATAAASVRDASITSAPVERRHEPIVCQGARLLHIDNRNLVFDGDAVSAEDGCEIHITNSRITATGIGVLARAANVHIDNSLIEGDQASISASEGAQVYATSSQFKGLSRREDSAAFHDLGGNVWN
jgi:hypothetical protein